MNCNTSSSSKRTTSKKPNKGTCSSEYIVLNIEDDDDDEDPKQTLSVTPVESAKTDGESSEEALPVPPGKNAGSEVEYVKDTLATLASIEPEADGAKETLPIPALVSVKPEDKWLCQPSIAQVISL